MSYVRLSVNINQEAVTALSRKPSRYRYRPWMRRPKLSLTEKIGHAISLLKYFNDEADKGSTFRVVGPTGNVKKEFYPF